MNVAFIIGCARSGTSILGELIAAHPDVKYIFEAHAVWEWGGMGDNESHRLTAEHATPEVISRIRQWFQEQLDGHRGLLVEKCPRNVLRVPYLVSIFPEAKIIHIIRDGRDVACSMTPGIGGKEWSHLKPPSWRQLMASYEGPLRAALAWKEIMETALQDLANVPHLQVCYEELVQNPRQVACRILSYLNLSEHPAVESFCNKIQNDTTGSYHAKYQDKWYRNDHRYRIGRWRENLNPEEGSIIQHWLAPLLTQLGYTVDSGAVFNPGEKYFNIRSADSKMVKSLSTTENKTTEMVCCIAGMHRSGTSMLTRLLNICGLYLGPKEDLQPPGEDNPDGFWENLKFQALNEEILHYLGGGWDCPPIMDDDRLRTQEMQKFREKAISLVNEFKGKEPWGWKDPRNTLLIKFWREVIPGLKVVLSVRNPLDVAVSLNKRNNLSFAFSINLWLTYNKSIIERIPERDLLVTHYDNYFVNPERELERVTDFLNLRTSRELIKEACSTISKGLRHSISTIEDLRKIPYADEAIEIYQYLCNLADFNYECIANRSVSYPSKRYIEDTSSQNTMEKSQHIDERLIEVDRLNAIYRELRRTEILFVHEINGYLKAQQEEKEALLREVQARDLYIDKLKALLKESSEKLETASVASKRAEEIVKAFEKTIMDLKRDTLSASTSMAIGELCFNSGKYHEAKTFFYRALKEPELQPDAFNNLAVVSFNEGNPLSAKYYLLESLRIAPENKEAKMNLAQIERLSYDEDQFHEYLRAIPEKIQLHMHEKALFLDPWCHDFSVLGIKTPQRQNCSELNQNGQDEIFRLIKEAIRLCRETSDRAKGVELFSADAFYANYAVMAGADEMECVDIDDYEIAKAELITKILGNTERMIFNRGDVFKLSDSYDFCICAGGLYHLENPLELLELLSEKTRTALIIQTVYSLAHEADDYFETPPPGRKWGCRFSYGYLTKMLERSGWIVVSEKRDISVGNEKQADSGFAYLLCISGSVLERYGSVQLEALLKDRVVPYGLDRK